MIYTQKKGLKRFFPGGKEGLGLFLLGTFPFMICYKLICIMLHFRICPQIFQPVEMSVFCLKNMNYNI